MNLQTMFRAKTGQNSFLLHKKTRIKRKSRINKFVQYRGGVFFTMIFNEFFSRKGFTKQRFNNKFIILN